MPFRELGLDPRILQAVADAGYTEPTPIQVAAIPPALEGADLVGIAQTGTGKTAAFTLPILSKLAGVANAPRGTKVLILAPTRELALQIEENVRNYARHLRLSVATVFGGVSEQPQIKALRAGTDIIIACPGRLMDLTRRRFGDFRGLKHLVLDEGDRMLDMGFIPAIRDIVRMLPRERQTLMFSATLSPEIERLTHEFQRHPKVIQIGRRANPAETVAQWVYEVSEHAKSALLLHLLDDPKMNMVLVFCRMKHGADRLMKKLESRGIRTAALHSNRSQNQRLRALADFKTGAIRVLVATDIAARGIDVDGISHVVNFDFPSHPEDYIHRIGRTGRAHAVGDAISFVTHSNLRDLRSLERFIGRGLIRKKAEDFNPPAQQAHEPSTQPPRHPHHPPRGQQQRHPQAKQRHQGGPAKPGQQGFQATFPRRHGVRSFRPRHA